MNEQSLILHLNLNTKRYWIKKLKQQEHFTIILERNSDVNDILRVFNSDTNVSLELIYQLIKIYLSSWY